MRKILSAILAACLMLTGAALADELVVNAHVEAGGAVADSFTIKPDEALAASVDARFSIEVMVAQGWGPDATTVAQPLTVYEVEYAPDGTITLTTDTFAPGADFTITYGTPAKEATETEPAVEASVIKTWTKENVTRTAYDVVDDFELKTFAGSYTDAEGNTVELPVVYRIYAPENAQGLPMVVALHGSGESGNDGTVHVTASEIAVCWADPAWQAKHPCIVVAPQWPNADVSNDLELRDKYLEVYKAMFDELQATYAPSKSYLATLSMGSRVGFRYLELYPDTFDACLMVCGAKQNADLSKLSSTPVWLVHAMSDFVNKAQGSVDVYNQLVTEAGNTDAHLTLLTDEKMNGVFSHASRQFVYTTFSQEITSFKQNDTTVEIEVTVKNTGSVPGKDVVEIYFTPPYTNGGIEKASVNLLDFGKTDVLEPNGTQKLTFSIPMEDMASYDSSCIKTANGGYILEAGEYTISIRSDSHTVIDSESFTLAADVDYSAEGRPSDKQAPVNRFGYAEPDHVVLSRKDGFANLADAMAAPSEAEFELSKDDKKIVKNWSVYGYDPTEHDNPDDVMPTMGAQNGLKLADLTGKDYNDPMWEQLLDQMSLEDMITLVNTGGWKTAPIESVGKVATSDCDGPAGLSNYVTRTMGTQFCTEVMLAQTWNKDIAGKFGSAIAQEFANAENYGWYGPGMNLHRTAFSGRNFEYFSEDGVLSGKMASAEINAAVQYGVYPFMKHFAANDQETNRCAFLLTYLTEQTLRENVLKPFEIAVKNFDFDNYVLGAMSSYNWIGTVPVISNRDLLTDVLRGEWGFIGTVISDYNGSYGYQISDAAVRAGNDLMLGYGMAESNQFTDTAAATCVLALRQACKNILYTVGNSGYYADGVVIEEGGMDNMNKLFLTVDVAVGAAVVLIMAIVLIRWALKRRKAKKAKAA